MSLKWWAAVAALFLAWVFLHQPITDFCEAIATRYGFFAYDHGAAVTFLVGGIVTAVALPFGRCQSTVSWTAFAVLAVAIAVAQPILILNSVENIHFPQYAATVFLLCLAGLSPVTAWLAATLLGVADEGYQYVFLRAGRPDPLDWNDITLNAIGAAMGVVMLLHFGVVRARKPPGSSGLIVALVAPLAALGWWLSPPTFAPFYKVAASGFKSHVFSPGEGLVVVGTLWLGVSAVVRRLSAGTSPGRAR